MTLLVQDLKRRGFSREHLLSEHGVHEKEPVNGKVSFVYDQIAAQDTDTLAQQCRGLILREGSWDVVAAPFFRFFNHGQGAAADVDWATARFIEKLDGTLVIAYFDDGRWQCATRSCAEAQGVGPFGCSFAELVERTCREMGHGSLGDLLSDANRGHTLMLELTAPENRIVCDYPERTLSLLGARDNVTLFEVHPDDLELDIPRPHEWKFSDFDEMTDWVSKQSPSQHEGVVVRDDQFRRIKVKSAAYVAAHHMGSSIGATWRSVFQAVAAGQADDVIALLPDHLVPKVEHARDQVTQLINDTRADFERIKQIDDMREYAGEAKRCRFQSALFALKRGKTESIESFVSQIQTDTLMSLCGVSLDTEVGAS